MRTRDGMPVPKSTRVDPELIANWLEPSANSARLPIVVILSLDG
jgi:hypothetical protein